MLTRIIRATTAILGALIALLGARLTLQLFAARPDNAVFATVRALTAPLVAPFAALDAGQPRFGAVLEFSTLALLLLMIALVLVLRFVQKTLASARTRAQKGHVHG